MKKAFILSLTVIAALLMYTAADAAQTTYRCESMADTYMDEAPANINTNYGTLDTIKFIPSTTNTRCRGLIRFNIPPFISASQIVSATAYLYSQRTQNYQITADFYAAELPPSLENWWEKPGTDPKKGDFYGATWKISGGYDTESFWASWDNATKTGGGGDYDSSVVSSGQIGPYAVWNAIDLTTLVTGNLDKVRKHGILIKVQNESSSTFQRVASRDETLGHQPYLELVVDLELPDTTHLCPTISDVYLDNGYPDSNFYHKTRVFLASEAGTKKRARALWQFEIPESLTAEQIDNAILHLSGAINAGGTGGAVYCHNLNAPFAEELDTWNTLAGGDFDTSVAAAGTLPAGGDWETTIDISSLLSDNLTKVRDNGIAMVYQNEVTVSQTYNSLASKEGFDDGDFAAYLEITFADADSDGIPDFADNCTDTDNDGYGNPDFPANTCPVDNCPLDANPGQEDAESDGSGDACDNCPSTANGPLAGTCVKEIGGVSIGTGVTCTLGGTECLSGQICQLDQEDMNGNGIGDVCECYADCNHDTKVNTTDLGIMKTEFFRTDCATIPCQADLNGDDKVNTSDLGIMKVEFFRTGCPTP